MEIWKLTQPFSSDEDDSPTPKLPATATNYQIREIRGSLFDAPTGSALIHACNAQGTWGKGIAATFKHKYPAAFQVYRTYCMQLLQHITTHPIPDLGNGDMHPRSVRFPLGTALIIEPQSADYELDRKSHWIICLFTSYHYRARVDAPDLIISSTYAALRDLKEQLEDLDKSDDTAEKPTGLFACRFNSGAFGVPWKETRKVIQEVGLDMTVMYTDEADDQGSLSKVA
ncbi:Appr-1-p processing [Penicillium hispanicum]|uniref:Appr-1-p processing n=1 Tax=Penicillium hispanicum TaxID=1080232 RepID=UPI00253FE534|nr:Appr-1-p processing [Penicillium hispanicum]KAJ5578734.1 Appr-1-p processing [Penicillium hispanicum]